MISRRELRAIVLKALAYQNKRKKEKEDKILNYVKNLFKEEYKDDFNDKENNFIDNFYFGVLENKEEIDEKIKPFLKDKKIENVSNLNLNILRMAFYEILIQKETPIPIAINEAINLSKKFNPDEGSHKFISGVLGNLREK